MSLNLEDLKAACFEVAQHVKWKRKPQLLADIQEQADFFYALASKKAQEIHEKGENAEIVNRAVWYLSQVHAIPQLDSDIRWFKEMLDALLELALPKTHVAVGKPQAFLHDLLRGITWSIENPYDSKE